MDILNILSMFSSIIPLIAGIVVYRCLTKPLKILLILFVVGAVVELIGYYFLIKQTQSVWVFHVYTLLEFSLLVLVFSYWQKGRIRKWLRFSIGVFFLMWLAAKFSIEGVDEWDSYTGTFEGVFLIAVSAGTFFNLIGENLESLLYDSRFWVASAVLIYFSGTLLTFALSNTIAGSADYNLFKLTLFHPILNIISNLCYAGGFLCKSPRLTSG